MIVAVPAMTVATFHLLYPVLYPVHQKPTLIIGAEVGPNGSFSRRVTYEGSYRVITTWLPDPDEPRHEWRAKYRHFYFETPTTPRIELLFLPKVLPDSIIMRDLCKPVENTSLWVAAGYFLPGNQINLVVFDLTGIRTSRQIAISSNGKNQGFWFRNGNKTIKFRSKNGIGTYDVVNDVLTVP